MIGDGKFVCGGGDSTATRHGTGTGATRGSRGREVQTKLAVVDACDTFGWFVCGGGGAGCRGRGRGVRNEQTWLNANAGRAMMLLRDKKQKTEGADTQKHISDDVALWSKQNLGSAGGK